MSVLTTLALMATALKAAVGREQQAHMKQRASLWPELDGSAEELAKAKARVEELEGDVARANIQYRRDQELIEIWRARALANIPAVVALPQPAGPDFRPPHIAQQQAAAWAQQSQLAQQQNAQMAQQQFAMQQNLQNGLLYGQGLMMPGAQALNNPELWCNCVPSRAQVWAADGAEA